MSHLISINLSMAQWSIVNNKKTPWSLGNLDAISQETGTKTKQIIYYATVLKKYLWTIRCVELSKKYIKFILINI